MDLGGVYLDDRLKRMIDDKLRERNDLFAGATGNDKRSRLYEWCSVGHLTELNVLTSSFLLRGCPPARRLKRKRHGIDRIAA